MQQSPFQLNGKYMAYRKSIAGAGNNAITLSYPKPDNPFACGSSGIYIYFRRCYRGFVATFGHRHYAYKPKQFILRFPVCAGHLTV